MEWGKGIPQEPGYYWFRHVGMTPIIKWCWFRDNETLMVDDIPWREVKGLLERSGVTQTEWYGPVRPPK